MIKSWIGVDNKNPNTINNIKIKIYICIRNPDSNPNKNEKGIIKSYIEDDNLNKISIKIKI